MSARSNHWCWAQEDVAPAELLVMLAISDRCDESGFGSYQSVETIAKKAKMSDRNARRVITELEARGKLKRHDRPGRTTEVQIVIPDDFGRRRRADKLAGVGEDNSSGAKSGAAGGQGADNLSGVEGGADKMAGAPDKLAGGADNLAADSSLPIHSPYKSEDARARAPDGAGAALTREEHRRTVLLRHRAMVAGVSPPTKSESLDDAERRISEAETRQLQAREEQFRRDRAQSETSTSATQADEEQAVA